MTINSLPRDNINALYVDDVSVLSTRPTLEQGEESAHQAVDKVAEWAKKWKLKLNATKSESNFFSTNSREVL